LTAKCQCLVVIIISQNDKKKPFVGQKKINYARIISLNNSKIERKIEDCIESKDGNKTRAKRCEIINLMNDKDIQSLIILDGNYKINFIPKTNINF